jgi:hypothetical protein
MIKKIVVEETMIPIINFKDCDTTKIIIAITQNNYYFLKEILRKEWIWVNIETSSIEYIDKPLIKYQSAKFAIIDMLSKSDIVHILQIDSLKEITEI